MSERGAVYIFHAMGTDLYKIGWTNGDPLKRMADLQTGCPHKLRFVKAYIGTMKDEKSIHFQFWDTHYYGEWFLFSKDEALYLFGYKWVDFRGESGPYKEEIIRKENTSSMCSLILKRK